MELNQYLESTYLKTAKQANLSKVDNLKIVIDLINEAIENQFILVMIRPKHIHLTKKMIQLKKVNY